MGRRGERIGEMEKDGEGKGKERGEGTEGSPHCLPPHHKILDLPWNATVD